MTKTSKLSTLVSNLVICFNSEQYFKMIELVICVKNKQSFKMFTTTTNNFSIFLSSKQVIYDINEQSLSMIKQVLKH